MTQRGEHTWDLIVNYHRCPSCGRIIESREDYAYRLGKYVKELECDRCQHRFVIEKPVRPKFGPLIGEPEPADFDWEQHSF